MIFVNYEKVLLFSSFFSPPPFLTFQNKLSLPKIHNERKIENLNINYKK